MDKYLESFLQALLKSMETEDFPHPEEARESIINLYNVCTEMNRSLAPVDQEILSKYISKLMRYTMAPKNYKAIASGLLL